MTNYYFREELKHPQYLSSKVSSNGSHVTFLSCFKLASLGGHYGTEQNKKLNDLFN